MTRRCSLTRRLLTLLLVSAALVAAGCGSSSNTTSNGSGSSTKVHFAKTKFALHAGLAFGTFHHFIYKPFKAGDFSHPFSHKFKILEAVAAAVYVKHEASLALTDAKASKLLSHVVAPLTAFGGVLALIRSSIKSAKPDAQAIDSGNSSVSSAETQSSYAGQPIQETVGSP
jgi:hypothetical protein